MTRVTVGVPSHTRAVTNTFSLEKSALDKDVPRLLSYYNHMVQNKQLDLAFNNVKPKTSIRFDLGQNRDV